MVRRKSRRKWASERFTYFPTSDVTFVTSIDIRCHFVPDLDREDVKMQCPMLLNFASVTFSVPFSIVFDHFLRFGANVTFGCQNESGVKMEKMMGQP